MKSVFEKDLRYGVSDYPCQEDRLREICITACDNGSIKCNDPSGEYLVALWLKVCRLFKRETVSRVIQTRRHNLRIESDQIRHHLETH